MSAERTPDHHVSDAPEPAESVTVRVEHETLVLRNLAGRRVGCVVVDAELMMIATYPPGGGACITLDPLAQATVPFAAILGYSLESGIALLHWWPHHASSEPLGADDYVRTIEITLRS